MKCRLRNGKEDGGGWAPLFIVRLGTSFDFMSIYYFDKQTFVRIEM